MTNAAYGFSTTLKNADFNGTLNKVTECLKAEGFGVLTEIDVKATLKKKIDVDFRPYHILGACNPPLAHQALLADGEIGLLLPCNVIVQQGDDNEVKVSFIDPKVMFQFIDNPAMGDLAADVESKLRRVMDAL